MYPVTDKYIAAAEEIPIRGEASCYGQLFALDNDIQKIMSATSTSPADLCTTSDVTKITADKSLRKATMEQDWTAADGNYGFDPAPYWISDAVSSTTPDANGEYPIDSNVLRIEFDGGVIWPRKDNGDPKIPLCIVSDGAYILGVEYMVYYGTVAGGWSDWHNEPGDITYYHNLISNDPITAIEIHPLTISKPGQRVKITGVYAGFMTDVEKGTIADLQYTDINDGLCMELPGKKLTCTMSDPAWNFDPLSEYTDPTFVKWETQLLLWCSIGGNPVPMGRYFMESYNVVDKRTVRFTFSCALGLLNEFKHYWQYMDGEIGGSIRRVIEATYQILDDVPDIKTPAQNYGISLDLSKAVNMNSRSFTSLPLVSGSMALQLYANLSGNVLRSRRIGDDLEMLAIPTTTDPCRSIDYVQVYDDASFSREKDYGVVVCDEYEPSGDEAKEMIASDITIQPGVDVMVISEKGLAGVVPVDASGEIISSVDTVISFSNCAYFRTTASSSVAGVYIRASVSDRKKARQTQFEYDPKKETLVLSNPLVNNRDSLPVSTYALDAYNELKHNITMTVNHRGYPEIDAGDIIQIQAKSDGPYIKARVLENKLDFRSGALKGTTKVRLLQ